MMLCMYNGCNDLCDFNQNAECLIQGPHEALVLLMMKRWMVKYFFATSLLVGNLFLAYEYSRHFTGEESFTSESLFLLKYASTVMTGWFIIAVPLFCIMWGSEQVKDPLLKMIGVRGNEK